MNQDEIVTRIKELTARRDECQAYFQRMQSDILILTGAIDENINHLNKLINAENLAKENAERELAKKSKKRKAKVLDQTETSDITDASLDEPEAENEANEANEANETTVDLEQEDLAA